MTVIVRSRLRRRAAGGGLLILALTLGGATAACSGEPSATVSHTPPAASGTGADGVPMGSMTMPTEAESRLAWEARPEYVRSAHPETQVAYAFALARPDVLQWLPCYCGCEAMDHRSNLDCFFRPRAGRGALAFEQHASVCDVCVKTAAMAQQMLRQGKSMIQIRDAVDATYGGLAPGTPTELPPA